MSQQYDAPQSLTERSVSGDAHARMMFEANRKSTLIAYALWFFFGWVCAHLFYMGLHTQAFIRIGLAVVSFLLMVSLIAPLLGWLGFAVLGTWWFVDAFLIPNYVVKANTNLATRLGG